MQVLVADDEITSRVLVETALRERGHTVRNCEDGFEAAKILTAPHAPRIAVISNTLARLRGIDVCRFLSAMGKKTGVYVILVSDIVDMELVELCRRAGVDDVVRRPLAAAAFHSRFDAAERVVELEEELRRIQGILQGLSNFESPLDKKSKLLRDANAALLDSAKKKGDAVPVEAPPAQNGAARPPEKPVQKVQTAAGAVYRGVKIVPDKEPKPVTAAQSEVHSLLGEPLMPSSRSSQKDIDAILYGPPSPAARQKMADSAAAAASREEAALLASVAAQTPAGHDEAQQEVLANAQQLQSEELADEELIHPFELDEIILNVFSGMGVTLKTELPPKAIPAGPSFASWVGVAIPSEPVWLDVLLVAGADVAKAVTRELLGQAKVADSDVCEMFAELQ
ncbi:MAG TPA: response regulator, partial [Opitutales bacterium]|nr:response regulator [Opitutales bacterium]